MNLARSLALCSLVWFGCFADSKQLWAQANDALRVVVIEFEGDINPFREAYFNRKLEKAKQLGAGIVIVEIDSPGGYIDSSLNLANTLREVDWAKTVAYVPRQALSGAAIMALGCDEIVMAATARIGDAGPIFMGDDFLFRHAPEKIRSDLVRQVRDLADVQKRPPAIAEAMVDLNLEVFKVAHADTGEVSYKSDAELEALDDPTEWKKVALFEPSKTGSFLEINGQQAMDVGYAEAVVESRAGLARRFGKQAGDLTVMQATWVDGLVMVLNSGWVTGLLFVVGLIALYLEFAAPGIGVGGMIAGLCFSLFFWSRMLGGTAGWLEVVLFVSGVAFILMELFVIPGFGIAGFLGVLMLVTSLIMASQRFAGSDGISTQQLTSTILVLSGAGAASIVGMFIASRYVGSLAFLKHLTLEPPAVDATGETLATGTDRSDSGRAVIAVGDEGVADSALRPSGRVRFGGAYHDVITDGSFVASGARVRVIKVSGIHITVREIA